MITKFFLDLVLGVIKGSLSIIQVIGLPLDLVTILGNITIYGCWVLGADLFILCIGVVFSFFLLRLSIGFVEWVYHLIPLC